MADGSKPGVVKSYKPTKEEFETMLQGFGNKLQPIKQEKPQQNIVAALRGKSREKQQAERMKANSIEQKLITDIKNCSGLSELITKYSGKLLPRYLTKQIVETMKYYGFKNSDIYSLFNFTTYSYFRQKMGRLGIKEKSVTA